ncbi:hypothetical protein CN918_26915 [Priestia megaterium]|nr:hypothetical protein CN918_26915 [Priestia megaterium]
MRSIHELTFETFIELYVRQNQSLQDIANTYGVSRQRIHQIKKEYERTHGKIQRNQPIDSFTLKRLLDEGKSLQEIADLFNIKLSKVHRLIKKYEEDYLQGLSPIKIVRTKIKDVLSKSFLHQLYVKELLTDKEIAERFGCSPATVWLLRKEYEISSFYTKGLRRLKQVLNKETFYYYYVEQNYNLQQLAKMYDCHLSSIYKLKQDYNIKK